LDSPENNPINWDEIIKSNKGVVASNDTRCGNVIAQTDDEIVISEGLVNRHQFIMMEVRFTLTYHHMR
jgi:hypothetical protein